MSGQRNALLAVAEQWEAAARRRFISADLENDAMGKRLIEHGAVCLANCASELREALSVSASRPSAIPEANQKSLTSRV
jgi:hypothetical protein